MGGDVRQVLGGRVQQTLISFSNASTGLSFGSGPVHLARSQISASLRIPWSTAPIFASSARGETSAGKVRGECGQRLVSSS